MQEVKYDADVLRAFALVLYQRAESMVFWSTAIWSFIAFVGVFGAAASARTLDRMNIWEFGGVLLVTVVAGLIGRHFATGRAWMLRLEAQRALCQLQVEINTRR